MLTYNLNSASCRIYYKNHSKAFNLVITSSTTKLFTQLSNTTQRTQYIYTFKSVKKKRKYTEIQLNSNEKYTGKMYKRENDGFNIKKLLINKDVN